MTDTKINIEVVCSLHPMEKLEVVSERGSNFYDVRLVVSACDACLKLAVAEIDPADLPTKGVELVFNESNLTSQTIEV